MDAFLDQTPVTYELGNDYRLVVRLHEFEIFRNTSRLQQRMKIETRDVSELHGSVRQYILSQLGEGVARDMMAKVEGWDFRNNAVHSRKVSSVSHSITELFNRQAVDNFTRRGLAFPDELSFTFRSEKNHMAAFGRLANGAGMTDVVVGLDYEDIDTIVGRFDQFDPRRLPPSERPNARIWFRVECRYVPVQIYPPPVPTYIPDPEFFDRY